MPTPSSNQSPDPSSPPPFSFSTCPDDVPRLPHSVDTVTSSVEVQPESALDGPSLPSFASRDARGDNPSGPEVLVLSRQPSTEPSSRATTVSPGPPSTTTDVTSPAPSASGGDDAKSRDAGLDGGPDGPVSQASSVTSQHPSGVTSTTSAGHDVYSQDLLAHDDDHDLACSTSLGMEYSNMRTIPISPSSYLRPGSRFHGTQQSERQVYDVQVEIKHVDMRESFLCGYLRIQGLTEDHPTLTTYFEGEIIGSKYGFLTRHEDWGANMKTDLNHWSKFSAFRPFQKHVRKGPVLISDVAQRENIFMRWKEHFLVPDHRVRTITGASFEGFYYICFNQLKGEVNGIYFHSKSEKFQQLELKHVPNHGCFSATEFR
ncbi:hypothetical protein CDD83_9097 [Cordyceps sp. RAO-2017]|nr:hypothetical protein CDD83_9097 [Cordyceps sp. RAO-2017]